MSLRDEYFFFLPYFGRVVLQYTVLQYTLHLSRGLVGRTRLKSAMLVCLLLRHSANVEFLISSTLYNEYDSTFVPVRLYWYSYTDNDTTGTLVQRSTGTIALQYSLVQRFVLPVVL